MQLSKNQKQIGMLILFFVIAVVLWDTFFIYPVKLFVVILHEMSHGIAAIFSGGSIVKIQIDSQIGGYCQYLSSGGNVSEFFIASAGYLGSLFWGGLILMLASKTEKDRTISAVIGGVVLFLSYFVIKTGEAFGIVFTLLFGIFMLVSAKFLPMKFHDTMLKFLGLTSCLYVIIDIKDDLIVRSGIGSDADAIANLTGIPSVAVGVIWIIIALVSLFFILRSSLRETQKSS
ncbi:MAG TPA: hypothetical protein DHW82_08970 [Spirochaetia bacterium]|nr:MAG: hypothetical protein A2Y41_09595 [Spirochaetes bacterium GWB1_36_13]HCL57122.1 hypothetical protein [Spirochaetia bacterium]